MEMSSEANSIMTFMLKDLSGCKYGYRQTVEGCYKTAIQNYNYPEAEENMDDIIDRVIEILNGG